MRPIDWFVGWIHCTDIIGFRGGGAEGPKKNRKWTTADNKIYEWSRLRAEKDCDAPAWSQPDNAEQCWLIM